ncbi:MAG: hypothetical protein GY862_37270 [Gammaproteobacteria bacterium]|nr:hypothetical protein [Gammaproteobacteria bacterium]
MRYIIIFFAVVLSLAGCQGAGSVKPDAGSDSKTETPSNREVQAKQEMEELFSQALIDPLTKYIEKYRDDKYSYVEEVLAEREKRCEQIELRYQKREKTRANLIKLTGGYDYSCPQVVERFTKAMAQENSQGKEIQEPAVASSEQLSSEQPSSEQPSSEQPSSEQPSSEQPGAATELSPPEPKAADKTLACRTAIEQQDSAAIFENCLTAQEDPDVQFKLGELYAKGTGTARDFEEAAKWYRLAAEQGNARAQHNLGAFYVKGKGVSQDFVLGYMWFSLSAAQGDQNAIEANVHLYPMLTPTQITEAQRLVRERSSQ